MERYTYILRAFSIHLQDSNTYQRLTIVTKDYLQNQRMEKIYDCLCIYNKQVNTHDIKYLLCSFTVSNKLSFFCIIV